MRETEGELFELTTERGDLERQASAVIGPKNRLKALQECLTRKPLDVTAANTLLRQVVKEEAVDYERGDLLMRWVFGGESRFDFAKYPSGRVIRSRQPIK